MPAPSLKHPHRVCGAPHLRVSGRARARPLIEAHARLCRRSQNRWWSGRARARPLIEAGTPSGSCRPCPGRPGGHVPAPSLKRVDKPDYSSTTTMSGRARARPLIEARGGGQPNSSRQSSGRARARPLIEAPQTRSCGSNPAARPGGHVPAPSLKLEPGVAADQFRCGSGRARARPLIEAAVLPPPC